MCSSLFLMKGRTQLFETDVQIFPMKLKRTKGQIQLPWVTSYLKGNYLFLNTFKEEKKKKGKKKKANEEKHLYAKNLPLSKFFSLQRQVWKTM